MLGEHAKNSINLLGLSLALVGYIYIGYKEHWTFLLITGGIAVTIFIFITVIEFIELINITIKEFHKIREAKAQEYIKNLLNT